ncbi:MAG: hypothetical protein AVDCRST_MAG48-1243 [uncultured Friedmanniella sp.]|uniref:Uncharacterized protein n=1 Tax=uncultured Friedmanniella sp. TaxID=335381 RepID=A0A6J4K9T8_9ACTN|nr:MAG: hypothetical protein AVDCRST_MAG48-1243 [uncultured Friedmanniella sp.]
MGPEPTTTTPGPEVGPSAAGGPDAPGRPGVSRRGLLGAGAAARDGALHADLQVRTGPWPGPGRSTTSRRPRRPC